MLSKYTQAGNWPISGPKQSMLPGATFYSNFDQGGFIGSGTEIMNLTERTENMVLTNMNWTYRANSPNSLEFDVGNQGVIDLPSNVCSLNDTTTIAICVWIKPRNITTADSELFYYAAQNPGPGNLQTFRITLSNQGTIIGTRSSGSVSNTVISATSAVLTANQWSMLTFFIKGGLANYPRIYLDNTIVENRGLIMNYSSTQPMRFTFNLAAEWDTEWNNLQIWPNGTLINPVTKFAAERAYYGR